jgi:hypothetical protein
MSTQGASRLRRTGQGLAGAGLLILAAAAGPAQAALRQFSYDPADAETHAAAGALTFLINQTLLSTRVLKVRATDAAASANLKRSDPSALGHAIDLRSADTPHDLYEVLPTDDGPALIAAFCPDSKRAWMAFTPVRFNEDLRVLVIGDDPKGGGARLCKTLNFTFHGEWRVPPGQPPKLGPVEPPDFPKSGA